MGSHVFLVGESGGIRPLRPTAFASESQLDQYVEAYPELLAIALSTESQQLTFAIVERQASIDEVDGRAARWSADLLLLDQTGTLTIVEDKLSRNVEIRRKVVGQMIEYVANLLTNLTSDGLKERIEKWHGDANEVVRRLLGIDDGDSDEFEITNFWNRVTRNLQAGAVRMAFIGDHLPAELRQIIEFLNQYMNPMEVVGVEIGMMVDPQSTRDTGVLVSSVVGRSERRQKNDLTTADRRTPIGPDEFRDELRRLGGNTAEGNAAVSLFDCLIDVPTLQTEIYRTAGEAAETCRFKRRRDEQILLAVSANHRRNRCHISTAYQRWNWSDELIQSLSELLGFQPSPLGKGVIEWCAECDANVEALAEWAKAQAAETEHPGL